VSWILRLVKTGAEGEREGEATDVMEINRPDDLRDIATLGLTLSEAKQLLSVLQREIVAAQAGTHAALRPDCPCGRGVRHVKDCHVRFQGFRTQNPARLFSFRLISLMQACAVEGGH
jgi:hypothetical protein